MAEELHILVKFLKKKNLKLTEQRQEILKAFLEAKRHVSIENLYDILKKKDPGIGQATVFRTLKLLCEADIAKEVILEDRKLRYEPKYGHEHHDHLICNECGRFIEAVDTEIERLQNRLCKKFGFLPDKHRLQIFGICKQCKKRLKKQDRRKE